MFEQVIESVILLFVAVDPIALIPIFASLTQGLNKQEIKKSLYSCEPSFAGNSFCFLAVWSVCIERYGYINELF